MDNDRHIEESDLEQGRSKVAAERIAWRFNNRMAAAKRS